MEERVYLYKNIQTDRKECQGWKKNIAHILWVKKKD